VAGPAGGPPPARRAPLPPARAFPPGAAAQAADSGKVFKAIGDYLGYKPADTDTLFVPTDAVRPRRAAPRAPRPARRASPRAPPKARRAARARPSDARAPATPPPFPAPRQAFAALAKQYGLKSPTEFLSPRYEALLARVGAYHIHEDAPLKAAQLKDGQKLDTLLKGESLTLQK
jgi:hypothetical protein